MRVEACVELKGCRILVGKNDGWIKTSDGEISCHKPDLITRQLNVSDHLFLVRNQYCEPVHTLCGSH